MASENTLQSLSGQIAEEENSSPDLVDDTVTLQDLTNEALIARIIDKIRREIIDQTASGVLQGSAIQVSELEIDYWSYVFQVNWQVKDGQRGVFVKIPRCPWDSDTIVHSFSNPRAIQMGQTEFLNLSRLYEFWKQRPDDKRFGAIKPLAYWPEWNAIITERVFGADLYLLLRRAPLLPGASGSVSPKELNAMIGALGEWLADFQLHFDATESQLLDSDDYAADIEKYWQIISSHSRCERKVQLLAERVNQIRIRNPQKLCSHLEGFEIRNVIVEKSSNRLFVLDPGQIMSKCYLENIIDFLISLDILYWGTAWFIVRRAPPRAVHDAFLQGFARRAPIAPDWLLFFKIKELIHSWSAACLVLNRKRVPALLKPFFQAVYIDRFYIHELAMCLAQLDRLTAVTSNNSSDL